MKRVIAVLMALVLLLPCTLASAEGDSYISFDKVKIKLLENNGTIKQLDNAEKQARIKYDDSVRQAKSINTEGKAYENPMTGEDGFFRYPVDVQMLFTKQKELLPESMKYAWEATANAEATTEKSLVIAARGLYLGVMAADKDYTLKQQKLKLAEKKHSQNIVRYEQNLITKQALNESEYNLLKAQTELKASGRSRDNAIRSLNAFIGVPIDTPYDRIWHEGMLSGSKLQSSEYYVDKALKERSEIVDIQRQLVLKRLQKSIIEKNQVNEIYTDIADEQKKLIDDIDMLNMKLDTAKYTVEKEIKNAYADVVKECGSVDNMKIIYEMQKATLKKLEEQYKQGYITDAVLEEMKISVNEVENGLMASIFSYNTKIMKLENAAGLGPAY